MQLNGRYKLNNEPKKRRKSVNARIPLNLFNPRLSYAHVHV